MHRFATPTPPRLTVELRAGSLVVQTAEVSETTVEVADRNGDDPGPAVIVEQRGDEVVVLAPDRLRLLGRSPHLDVRVTAPTSTALDVRTGSAAVAASGTYGTASITTGSGSIDVDHVGETARVRAGSARVRIDTVMGDLEVRTGSGAIDLGTVGGALDVQSGSGEVRLAHGGRAMRAKTGSGDVRVGDAPEQATTLTGSGDVRIDRATSGEIDVRAASGDVHVGVAAGTAAWLDVNTTSGRLRSELDSAAAPGDGDRTVRLRLQTASGDIDLVRV